jgi:hypothetical protein
METEAIWLRIWRYLWPILLITLGISLVVGLSFLFVGEFTWGAYSDRLFWDGIAAVLVGGLGLWAALGSYNTLGTPSVLTAPGDARIAHERVREYLRMNARRYTFAFRMFAVGLICMVASALIEVLSR